jgi:hypothetical protein
MPHDAAVRKHVIDLLTTGNAHLTFPDAVKDFPVDEAGVRPAGSPHSAWELLEHLRIAQEDILRFSSGPEGYVERKWPDEYWPASPAPKSAGAWNESVEAVGKDRDEFVGLLKDGGRDLFEPFSWGTGQTLLREALLVADHNAYHLGQLMLVRRMLEKSDR